MRTHLRATTITAYVRTHAVAAPGAVALAVRPNPINGQAQALVVCHLGVCPLHLNGAGEFVRLEPPLALRNQFASKFNLRSIHDAAYDPHSGMVIFAHSTGLYGMDARNQLTQLAGDGEGGLLFDGPSEESRFVGAQRVATDGSGLTYVRDRDTTSKNGFCLRVMQETTLSSGQGGSGERAVVTVSICGGSGPQAMTYDPCRSRLLFTRRGAAIHQLLPYGVTEELIGTDEPLTYNAAVSAAAASAAASASASASEISDASDNDAPGVAGSNGLGPQSAPRHKPPFANIQAMAADASSSNVYILDGTTGSRTKLLVLRPDDSLRCLGELRVGPTGSSRLPRLAVLPYGHLALYGVSGHDMMVLKL